MNRIFRPGIATMLFCGLAMTAQAQTITADAYVKMTLESRQFTISVVRSSLLTGMVSMAAANAESAEVAGENLARSALYSCLVNTSEDELATIVSAYLLDADSAQRQIEISELTVDALLDHC